jgi:hypothetical protein
LHLVGRHLKIYYDARIHESQLYADFASAKPVFGSVRGQRAVEYKIFLRQHPAQKIICTSRTKRDLCKDEYQILAKNELASFAVRPKL